MEYNGFISDLIERSESILRVGRSKGFEVTALLMLLSVGFVVPYERLRYWGDEDDGLRKLTSFNRIKKLAKKIEFDGQGESGILTHFSNLNFEKWKRFEFKNVKFKGLNFRRDVLPSIGSKSLGTSQKFSLNTLMRDLRNALAHGGIHPLSPYQISKISDPNNDTVPFNTSSSREISTVYLVEKWTEGRGVVVYSVPADELISFWNAWKSTLLDEIGVDGIADFDSAA